MTEAGVGKVVNLKRFKKRSEREQSAKQADANRARFGRTKSERSKDAQRAKRASELLDQHQLTDADADQLRAVSILDRGIDGLTVENAWLPGVKLLVLDGFFDFTPVQGEILRHLIPAIPNAIVNLNGDVRN